MRGAGRGCLQARAAPQAQGRPGAGGGSGTVPLSCWKPPGLLRLTWCGTSGRTRGSFLHGKFQVCTHTVCPQLLCKGSSLLHLKIKDQVWGFASLE